MLLKIKPKEQSNLAACVIKLKVEIGACSGTADPSISKRLMAGREVYSKGRE